jgi:hypothetical protein
MYEVRAFYDLAVGPRILVKRYGACCTPLRPLTLKFLQRPMEMLCSFLHLISLSKLLISWRRKGSFHRQETLRRTVTCS